MPYSHKIQYTSKVHIEFYTVYFFFCRRLKNQQEQCKYGNINYLPNTKWVRALFIRF